MNGTTSGISGDQFDANYFDNLCGPEPMDRDSAFWRTHFATAARQIVETFRPERVLDIGCGPGMLVEHLRELGVDATGIDISAYAISRVPAEIQPFCTIGSAIDPIDRKYDLITCVNVAQHLPAEQAARLVHNLCAHSDEVIFAVPSGGHDDPTCIHLQSNDDWMEIFAQSGFYPVLRHGPAYFGDQAMHFRKVAHRLRVAVFSREKADWAVVRVRLLGPLKELVRQGRVELTFVSGLEGDIDIEGVLDADLWVVHREFCDKEIEEGVLDAAALLSKPVVFEIDDLITNLPRSNPFWSYLNRIQPDLTAAMERADFVTASTDRLVSELDRQLPGLADKAQVLENCLDPTIWDGGFRAREQRPGEPLIIGWCGSSVHDDDLAMIRDAILYLVRKHGDAIEFHFHGDLPAALRGLPGVYLARGAVGDLTRHATLLRGATMHLAMAPLTDHPFNQCKSDIKWLEYSICGIPAVFSDVAPYRASIQDGKTGVLVKNDTGSWVRGLERLIEDGALRQEIARAAYDEVRASRCVDVTAGRWDDLYRSFVATGPRQWSDLDDDTIRAASSLLFRFRSRQQARCGHLGAAVAGLEAALALDEGVAGKIVASGRELTAQGDFAVAERLFRSVVRGAPEHADGHLALARLYQAVDDPIAQEAALRSAAEQHPADPDLAADHVRFLLAQDRQAEANQRLESLVAAEREAEEAVQVADMLVRMGRPAEALAVVDQAARAFPDTDFTPLLQALGKAAELGMWNSREAGTDEKAMRVLIFTAEPISGARTATRLRSPMRVLEQAALIRAGYSDGSGNDGASDAATAIGEADVIVIHRTFCVGSTEGQQELCAAILDQARQAGKPVLFELDDLPHEQLARTDEQAAVRVRDAVAGMIHAADATLVPTEALRRAILEFAPAAEERIVVFETCIDAEIWNSGIPAGGPAERAAGPFRVGLVLDWSTVADIRGYLEVLAPLVKSGEIQLSTWSPFTEPGAPISNSQNIGSATPHYREYAHRLQNAGLDLALVPVSHDLYHTTLTDGIAVELAASRVPALFSAREPFASSVIQGRTGLLLGDDPNAWAETVRRLISCPEMRADLASRSWNIAFAERTIQARAADWFELVQGLVTARQEAVEVGVGTA